jgi:hypothetical protein
MREALSSAQKAFAGPIADVDRHAGFGRRLASGSSSLKRRDKRRQTRGTMDSLCDRAAFTHYCCNGLDGLRRR